MIRTCTHYTAVGAMVVALAVTLPARAIGQLSNNEIREGIERLNRRASAPAAQPAKPDESTGERISRLLAKLDKMGEDGLALSSGDRAIDQFMAGEFLSITRRFDASPQFFYYDDSAQPNMMWTPTTIRPRTKVFYPALDKVVNPERNQIGTVLIGRNIVAADYRAARGTGELRRSYTVHAILAHELGHMVQFARKTRLAPAQQELLSDFLAGWSIRYEKRHTDPNLDETVVFSAFYKAGDNEEFRIGHHGTRRERLAAFLAGFDVEDDRIDVACSRGETFITALKPTPALTEEFQSLTLGIHYIALPNRDGSSRYRLTRYPASDSPAGRCGLEWGDIIVEFNAKPVSELRDGQPLRGKFALKAIDCRTGQPRDGEMDLP